MIDELLKEEYVEQSIHQSTELDWWSEGWPTHDRCDQCKPHHANEHHQPPVG